MRQAVVTAPGVIELREVPEPVAGPGEVRLRVQRVGVCGSDVHVNHGSHPFTPYPVVQGHEFSAVIEAVGEGVEGIEVGARATSRPQLVCGECGPCRRGDYHICDVLRVTGFQAPGCAQELFVTTPDRLVLLPDAFTPEQGALVEPTAVGVHSSGRGGDLTGENIVVLGAGPIGNLLAQVVKSRGAKRILLTDLSDYRLEIARECGIEHTSNAREEPLDEAASRVFGDEGFREDALSAIETEDIRDRAEKFDDDGREIEKDVRRQFSLRAGEEEEAPGRTKMRMARQKFDSAQSEASSAGGGGATVVIVLGIIAALGVAAYFLFLK